MMLLVSLIKMPRSTSNFLGMDRIGMPSLWIMRKAHGIRNSLPRNGDGVPVRSYQLMRGCLHEDSLVLAVRKDLAPYYPGFLETYEIWTGPNLHLPKSRCQSAVSHPVFRVRLSSIGQEFHSFRSPRRDWCNSYFDDDWVCRYGT